jgi:hypothetical protein
MRNVVLALVVLSTGPAAASAQSGAWADKLFKGSTSHDFGTVARGAQLSHKFTITNIYAVPLEISNVRTTCGCLTATPTKTRLQPQEVAYLDITMDGRKFSGPKAITIYLTVGPEYVSTATLKVSANARADVVFNPGEANFGVVPRGQTPTQVVEVEYAGFVDWRLTEAAQSAGLPFTAALKEKSRFPARGANPGRVAYQVLVQLKPDAPAGTFKHELFLKSNDPASPLLPLLVTGTVQASLTVAPNAISFTNHKVGTEKSQKVVVRGSRPFRVVAVEGAGGGITADLPTQPGLVQVLTIRCQPTLPGETRRQLLLRTDLEQEGPVSVAVDVKAVP